MGSQPGADWSPLMVPFHVRGTVCPEWDTRDPASRETHSPQSTSIRASAASPGESSFSSRFGAASR
jgi:hypothetical protein